MKPVTLGDDVHERGNYNIQFLFCDKFMISAVCNDILYFRDHGLSACLWVGWATLYCRLPVKFRSVLCFPLEVHSEGAVATWDMYFSRWITGGHESKPNRTHIPLSNVMGKALDVDSQGLDVAETMVCVHQTYFFFLLGIQINCISRLPCSQVGLHD